MGIPYHRWEESQIRWQRKVGGDAVQAVSVVREGVDAHTDVDEGLPRGFADHLMGRGRDGSHRSESYTSGSHQPQGRLPVSCC